MRTSAIALVDALGFKGIEKTYDAQSAGTALKAARTIMTAGTHFLTGVTAIPWQILGGFPLIKLAWFSDMICVVVQPPEPTESTRKDLASEEVQACLLDSACLCVGYLLRKAATLEVPLAFRGVVTVGDAIVDGDGDDIYFGPAIAEASSLYELADGAFVWLTPKAASLPPGRSVAKHRSVVPFTVPLKDGRSIDTLVVNPFIDVVSTAFPEIRAGIARAMAGDRLDIAIKRQHTLRFLDRVAATESTWPAPASLIAQA